MSDPDDYEVGYKKPPRKSRWVKTQSGNYSGRPRKNQERAISSRQDRRDILLVTEGAVNVKVGDEVEQQPFHIANLMAMRAKALAGHSPSQRYLDRLHRETIQAHEEANPSLTRLVEQSEAVMVNKSVRCMSRGEWRELKQMRRFSWRI